MPDLIAARNWRIANKPHFDALYGADTRIGHSYPVPIETEPKRWREANRAAFDEIYGRAAK